MARVSTRIQTIGQDFNVLIANDLSPKAASMALASAAKVELAKAQASNAKVLGYVPKHATYVDQRPGAAEETVRPNGVIVYEFELAEQIVPAVLTMLRAHSPVLTGAYQRSHVVFADGVEVDPDAVPLTAKEIAILNVQPYARKIERGFSKKAPDGVYQVVATLIGKRFDNIALIRFSYRSPMVLTKAGRVSAKAERASRVPAIIIVPR
jgi:hypothetical protein